MTVKYNKELKRNLNLLKKLLQKSQVDASDQALYISGMWLCMIRQNSEGRELQKINPKIILMQLKECLINQIPDAINKKVLNEYKRIFFSYSNDIRLSESILSEIQHIYCFVYDNFFARKEEIEQETGWSCLYLLQSTVESKRVYSPFDLAELMADVAEIDSDSCILDPCAGSGGLLLAANKHLHRSCNIVKGTLTGVEIHFKSYILAISNKIATGMNCELYWKDWNEIKAQLSKGTHVYNRLLINPDFGAEDKGWKDVKSGLDMLEKGGIGVALVQNSPGKGIVAECASEILRSHTLCGCIKMSINLFYPVAAVQTSVFIFRTGIPHDFKKDVIFVNFEDDGQKQGKCCQLKSDKVQKQYYAAVESYKQGKSVGNIPVIKDAISDRGDDWIYEKHVLQDSDVQIDDLDECLSDFMAFDFGQMLHSFVLKMKLPETKMKMFAIEDIFSVKSSRYPRKESESDTSGTVRVISNSARDNGVKGYSNLPASNPGNVLTLSSTTNENKVFYQDQPFIGFPHLVVLTPKKEIICEFNKFIGLYFVGEIQKAKRGRYNYNSKLNNKEIKKLMISVPVTNGNEIDCKYMENTVREMMSEKIAQLIIEMNRLTGTNQEGED